MVAREGKQHVVLDYLIEKGWAKDDQSIAKLLNTTPPVISRVRNDKRSVTPNLVLAIYDHTNLTIDEIRDLIKGKRP
jgi:plasmid maintenance system antidote protein VapI